MSISLRLLPVVYKSISFLIPSLKLRTVITELLEFFFTLHCCYMRVKYVNRYYIDVGNEAIAFCQAIRVWQKCCLFSCNGIKFLKHCFFLIAIANICF